MRFDKHILSLIFLVASLIWTLWFVFAGFGNHQDPLYWLYKYEHMEGGRMAVGTLLAGGAVVRLFGAQLLPLRFAGWLCVVTGIALPFCCLLDKEQRRANIHWLALTYFLMGYGAFQEFSPGTLSVLLLSVIWVLVVKAKDKTYLSYFAAVVAGLAVAARFPNILVLLVLIPMWRKKCLWNIPIVALTAGVVYMTGDWLVASAPMDGAMTSHDLAAMLSKLWTNGGKLAGFMLMAVGMLAFRGKKYAGPLVAMFVAYVTWISFKPIQWYNIDLTYWVSAVCIVLALFAAYQRREPLLAIGVLLLSVATLGTDTAWLKLFPAVLCLLPVTASYFEPDTKRYLTTVMAVLTIIVMIRMATNSVGQSDLTKATTVCSVSPYKHILVREKEQERLLQYKHDYDSLNHLSSIHHSSLPFRQETGTGVSILSVGQENHLMRAVTGCEAARYNEFWSNIFDSVYTAKYRTIIQEEHPVVFCSFSPQFKTKKTYIDTQSRFENMLREEGYQPINRSQYKYMIYVSEIQ